MNVYIWLILIWILGYCIVLWSLSESVINSFKQDPENREISMRKFTTVYVVSAFFIWPYYVLLGIKEVHKQFKKG